MFWNKFDSMLGKESSVQDVLIATEPENVTLASLFEKEDCIQETKARNPLLIKVLTRKDILLELVRFISSEPAGQLDAKNRFKDATIACEMLNGDVPEITEALTQSGEHLDVLLEIFQSSEGLNPILTSFVSRTLALLVARRPTEVLDYLSRKENFLDLCLKHLNVTAVTDLFIRLITAHENDAFRYKMSEWLNAQSFLEKTAAFLDARKTADPDFHNNSSQLICDVIRFSREQQLQQLKPEDDITQLTPETYANDLLKTADSEAFIGLIVSNLIRSANSQSAIVQCLTVLGAPFEFIPVNFDGNNEQKALFSELSLRVVNSRIERYSQVLSPVIPQLRDILLHPPLRNSLICQLEEEGEGGMSKRVGQVRLQMIRLLALLISFGRSRLNEAFLESGIILTALDMFFHFECNSFLHAQVQNCVSLILRNTPSVTSQPPNPLLDHPLLHQLIVTGGLQARIMEAWKSNSQEEEKGKARRPYMGHLLAMAMELSSQQTPNYSLVQLLTNDLEGDLVEEWRHFLATSIKPQAEIQSRCLAGVHPLQQMLSTINAQGGGRGAPTVAAFEYDSASLPSLGEEGQTELGRGQDGLTASAKSTQSTFDQRRDDEMRLRRLDGDEDDEDEDEDDDDDMTGKLSQAQISRLAQLATPPKSLKTPPSDWSPTQPLNLSEKAGIQRLEEAENANSPWDSAMKVTDDETPLPSEFPWKGQSSSAVPDGSDAWADFSNFPTGNTHPEHSADPFFTSSARHSLTSNSDSEGEPFVFQAPSPPKTPEPLELLSADMAAQSDIVLQEGGPGDVSMADSSVGASSADGGSLPHKDNSEDSVDMNST